MAHGPHGQAQGSSGLPLATAGKDQQQSLLRTSLLHTLLSQKSAPSWSGGLFFFQVIVHCSAVDLSPVSKKQKILPDKGIVSWGHKHRGQDLLALPCGGLGAPLRQSDAGRPLAPLAWTYSGIYRQDPTRTERALRFLRVIVPRAETCSLTCWTAAVPYCGSRPNKWYLSVSEVDGNPVEVFASTALTGTMNSSPDLQPDHHHPVISLILRPVFLGEQVTLESAQQFRRKSRGPGICGTVLTGVLFPFGPGGQIYPRNNGEGSQNPKGALEFPPGCVSQDGKTRGPFGVQTLGPNLNRRTRVPRV